MNTPLPETGYVRLAQIIGQLAVSPEQAETNRIRGKGPRTPRAGIPAIVPFSKSKLWADVKACKFPAPVKLGPRTTAWRIEDIRAYVAKAGV
jgi:prophage regulatory protein